jgi:hypothetical protein
MLFPRRRDGWRWELVPVQESKQVHDAQAGNNVPINLGHQLALRGRREQRKLAGLRRFQAHLHLISLLARRAAAVFAGFNFAICILAPRCFHRDSVAHSPKTPMTYVKRPKSCHCTNVN